MAAARMDFCKEMDARKNEWTDDDLEEEHHYEKEQVLPARRPPHQQHDVGGLEVKRKGDEEWISVKPTPGAYIVNVGDLIQIWSNDKYESVEHRVKTNSKKERYSIAFFLNPSHYIWVEPLEEFNDEENPTKHKGYRWGKYYATRKLSNFKKVVTAGNC
ncbi:hypothetical protein BUALT_Bualt15G0031600 [Buddleja alternifolia]|uniref:Fe2OG dioxygenase domain-containing protein n=1 Tax=Buddleja alternifolia TaxID=168488 RepID=A0AAV6WN01_9LAMI|nr:hypothetical protein BUALT_Bualt15G0031600 [Buddleja alternifolia]